MFSRPKVNSFVKTVLLQEMASKNNTYESGSLALKYKLDNEFELVFVAAYQKMLPLSYMDKLLDEIHLRFRDKYLQVGLLWLSSLKLWLQALSPLFPGSEGIKLVSFL